MYSLFQFLKNFDGSFGWKDQEELINKYRPELTQIIHLSSAINSNKFKLTPVQNKIDCLSSEFGLRELLPFLEFKSVGNSLPIASIIGHEEGSSLLYSKKIALRVYYMEKNQAMPPWGTIADEFLIGISGKVSMGVEDQSEVKQRRFHSSEPRSIQFKDDAAPEPFIGISLQWGKVDGETWFFNDSEHNVYDETIMRIGNVKDYYEDFAINYETNMKKWGYFLPRLVFDSFKTAITPLPSKELNILDLGCGDGLIGQEFFDEGYVNLSGFDFSPPMLAKSKEKNIYKQLHQGDLLQPLPFKDDAFECLLCISVTTYINPSVLEEWIRVIRPGGYLIFSHKSSVSIKWEPDQKKLENQGKWKSVHVTDPPVMFLPLLKEGTTKKPCEEKAIIYVYQKV